MEENKSGLNDSHKSFGEADYSLIEDSGFKYKLITFQNDKVTIPITKHSQFKVKKVQDKIIEPETRALDNSSKTWDWKAEVHGNTPEQILNKAIEILLKTKEEVKKLETKNINHQI